jgi:hypothetical protein
MFRMPTKRTSMKPGLRALASCGDGFWECDLKEGTAWFSDWFYEKLAWARDGRRTTLTDLQPQLSPASWNELMAQIRNHLEQDAALDLEFDVRAVGDTLERWRMRGRAHRNAAGRPLYLAGSMREVDGAAEPPSAALACLRNAFDVLPVAAALLDGHAIPLEANRLWREYPAATAAQAIARVRTANSQTAIEFWLDAGEAPSSTVRPLRVRAIAFQHGDARHLIVTLEDRRSD